MSKFSKELGNTMHSGGQFGISFKITVKNIILSKGDCGNFSREHGNTTYPWGPPSCATEHHLHS